MVWDKNGDKILESNETFTQASFGNNDGFEEYAILTGGSATKEGTKFIDTNANGTFDAGDTLGVGWTIYAFSDDNEDGKLDSEDDLVTFTTTDANGRYEFELDARGLVNGNLQGGKYIILEEDRNGYFQSLPGDDVVTDPRPGIAEYGYAITLAPGQIDRGNNFGNYLAATKSGTKFEDANANGTFDSGEEGLAGWTIYIDANGNNSFDAGESFEVTDVNGKYSFVDLKPGVYTFREDLKAGWSQSLPGGAGEYTETFGSGDQSLNNNFGNYQNATKSGTKFEDANANGTFDSGEEGLAGWTIYIDANNNSSFDAGESFEVTDVNGKYSFDDLKPGVYTFREDLKAGWSQSLPGGAGEYTETFGSGDQSLNNNFGNYQNATKCGTKYLDANSNGTFDSGEQVLSGWTIFIDANNNNSFDTGESFEVTDANGKYCFDDLKPGTYTFQEVLPHDWVQTEGGYTEVLESGDQSLNNNFGNNQLGECGWTPGYWQGGAGLLVWNGVANDEGQPKIAALIAEGKLIPEVGTYGDVLLLPDQFDKVVERNGGVGGNSYVASTSGKPDLQVGRDGELIDYNLTGDIGTNPDQIHIEYSDAVAFVSSDYPGANKLGGFVRYLTALILDDVAQPNYNMPNDLRDDAYDWLAKYAPLKSLGDVGSDGIDDYVIQYDQASKGFGSNGKFTIRANSDAWQKGDPGSAMLGYYENYLVKPGSVIFQAMADQFEGNCGLRVSDDDAYIYKGSVSQYGGLFATHMGANTENSYAGFYS